MKPILIAALYVASVVFSFGALNADSRGFLKNLRFLPDRDVRRSYRDFLAIAVIGAVIPILNIFIALLASGFLYDGWTLRVGPIERERKEL